MRREVARRIEAAGLLVLLFVAVLIIRDLGVLAKIQRTFESEIEDEEEHENDLPNEFMLYQNGIRTRMGDAGPAYEHGYLLREINNAKEHRQAQIKSNRLLSMAAVQFNERGPINVPGRVTALLNLPNDQNKISWLAGAATGGIWKTTDGGKNWSSKEMDLPALPISSFAIADDNTIYAGTGEYVSTYVYSAIGAGIFRSTDFGETWTPLNGTIGDKRFTIVTRIIVNPSNSSELVATCVPSNTSLDDNISYIMKSIDGGNSWSEAARINGAFEQVIYTPGNFNVQYASQNGVGVWRSVDAGNTWALSNSGMYPYGKSEIAVSRVNPNYVFASSESPINGSGSDLYLSKDAGDTWGIVDVKISGSVVDFLGGQGFYDDVIICDPFNQNIAYFGGVNLFQTKLNGGTSLIDNFKIDESGTDTFLTLQGYAGVEYDKGRLNVGPANRKATVELRFGPGISQRAYRFLVPAGQTSGVPSTDYSFQDYVEVPFQVWDVSTNKQLAVSFRDQNRNGVFDLLHRYPTSAADADPLLNSREYLFISDVAYDSISLNSSIATNGGQVYRLMYSIFPALAQQQSQWDPVNLPASKLIISYQAITKYSSSTQTVTDAYSWWDGKNNRDQENLSNGVHPDHHSMIPIIDNESLKTFKLLIGNDGGVFVTKSSTAPGTVDGDFIFSGSGLNNGQFYSADKKPGADRYIGGMQDNGTRISQTLSNQQKGKFDYAIGGDGFEVLWNNKKANEILGSVYYNEIYKSRDGGQSWTPSAIGINTAGDASQSPFYTKLTNSKDFPDRVFAIGKGGVFVSQNFGSTWSLSPILDNFSTGSNSFMDVEVSRANANIIWAGCGMYNGVMNIHVSTDGGITFVSTTNYSNLGYLTKLASHPSEASTAFAIFSFAGTSKILRTTDLGSSWQDITGFEQGAPSSKGFPDVAVFCVYVRPDNPDIIWAGTEIGIVESQDNGNSWSLLPAEQFPHVSVFDIKGQDDQVIIATNGRGIWTADIGINQVVNLPPSLEDFGTSPGKKLMLKTKLSQDYDSVEVFVDNKSIGSVKTQGAGVYELTMSGVAPGTHAVYFIGYFNSAPVQSETYSINQLNILSQESSYTTFFEDINDVYVQGMGLKTLSATNPKLSLQSDHNYLVNKTYSAEFMHPIKVSATQPLVVYSDLAIVAPGEVGKDSVLLEGSSDGLNWKPLSVSYNASSQPVWNEAYLNNSEGNSSMFIQHVANLKDSFLPGDVILIRIRFASDQTETAWGYALDYIFIQEPPVVTSIEEPALKFIAYPNPTRGEFIIQYNLDAPDNISIEVYDQNRKRIFYQYPVQRENGVNEEKINLKGMPSGEYIAVLIDSKRRRTGRIMLIE